MGAKDPRIDAYIAKSANFAKPILTHLRELIHDKCPTVEETMKWSFPHFMYGCPRERPDTGSTRKNNRACRGGPSVAAPQSKRKCISQSKRGGHGEPPIQA
jgi:uncharacterized protein DUF1801